MRSAQFTIIENDKLKLRISLQQLIFSLKLAISAFKI